MTRKKWLKNKLDTIIFKTEFHIACHLHKKKRHYYKSMKNSSNESVGSEEWSIY